MGLENVNLVPSEYDQTDLLPVGVSADNEPAPPPEAAPVAAPAPLPPPPVVEDSPDPARIPKGFRRVYRPTDMRQQDVAPPGLVEKGNIDLGARPVVKNGSGYSTVNTIGVNLDGKEYNLPTVTEDGRLLTKPDGSPDRDAAVAEFKRTGKHLGVYSNVDDAKRAAESLHQDQAQQYDQRAQSQGLAGAVTPPKGFRLVKTEPAAATPTPPSPPAVPDQSYGSLALRGVARGLVNLDRPGYEPPPPADPVDAKYSAPFDVGTMPDANTGKKLTYQLTKGLTEASPEMGGGMIGGIMAAALTRNPYASALGVAGGAIAVHTAKEAVPIFQAELKATPNDPDGAYARATAKLGIEDIGTGLGFAAFGWNPFKSVVKDLLFQALGVQPTIAATEKAGVNLVEGKPVLEGTGAAAVSAIPATIAPASVHYGLGGIFRGRGRAPEETPPPEEPPLPGLPPPGPDNRPSYVEGVTPEEHAAAANAARERKQQRTNESAGGWQRNPPADEEAPFTPEKLYGQGDRQPQSSDEMVGQDRADEAFRVAQRQRERAAANPETLDTQAAGRPEGVNAKAVFTDDGFPVDIINRRLVPDDRGRMVEVATVRRYDPRTGAHEDGSVEYDVPVKQLKQTAYAAEPRMATDFAERAEAPGTARRPAPEQPNEAGQDVKGGPTAPSEPGQTFRTTPPDPEVPNTDGPGSQVNPTRPYDNPKPDEPPWGYTTTKETINRAARPEQPDGPAPGPERSRKEQETIDEILRRWKEEDEARRWEEDINRARREGQERDRQWNDRKQPPPGDDASGTKKKEPPLSRKHAPQQADGTYKVDDDGYVMSDKGTPINFPDHKAAAKWMVEHGQKSPTQIFDRANHPTGRKETGPGASEATVTIREVGRRANDGTAQDEAPPPPPPPPGRKGKGNKRANTSAPPPPRPAGEPGPLPPPDYTRERVRPPSGAPPPPRPPGGGGEAPASSPITPPPGFRPKKAAAQAPATPPKPEATPETLMEYLSKLGIKGDDPALNDLSNADALKTWHHGKKFSQRILRPNGVSLNEAVQRAENEGFLGHTDNAPDSEISPTKQDLGRLDNAIGQHVKGNHTFRASDAGEGARATETNRFHAKNRDQIDEAAAEHGVDTTGMTDAEAEAAVTEAKASARRAVDDLFNFGGEHGAQDAGSSALRGQPRDSLAEDQFRSSVSRQTRLKGVRVFDAESGAKYDPMLRAIYLGPDVARTEAVAGDVSTLAKGERVTGWNDVKIKATDEFGTSHEVPAGHAAKTLGDRIKSAFDLLGCLG